MGQSSAMQTASGHHISDAPTALSYADRAGASGVKGGSVSNAATVQGIYEAFGKGDVPAILDVLADDVEWEAWEDNSAVNAGAS